jgi:hypothetical protein
VREQALSMLEALGLTPATIKIKAKSYDFIHYCLPTCLDLLIPQGLWTKVTLTKALVL